MLFPFQSFKGILCMYLNIYNFTCLGLFYTAVPFLWQTACLCTCFLWLGWLNNYKEYGQILLLPRCRTKGHYNISLELLAWCMFPSIIQPDCFKRNVNSYLQLPIFIFNICLLVTPYQEWLLVFLVAPYQKWLLFFLVAPYRKWLLALFKGQTCIFFLQLPHRW